MLKGERKRAKVARSRARRGLSGDVWHIILSDLAKAVMIFHQLEVKIAQRIGTYVGLARLSYENLYDPLAVHLNKSTDLDEVIGFDPDPRHVTRDKRARQSPVESGILALI